MIVLFKLIILTVMIVLAMRVAMSDKMLLENMGRYFERKVDEGYKVFDLFVCPWCSGTFFSLPAHCFAFGLGIIPFQWSWQLLIRWPLVVFGSCFISGMLWTIYLTLNQIKENSEAQGNYFRSINRSMLDKEEENEVK